LTLEPDTTGRKSRINETYINSILLLLQSYSFDELIKNKITSQRTKYSYTNVLKKIGLSKNHLAVDTVDIEKSDGFKEYSQMFV